MYPVSCPISQGYGDNVSYYSQFNLVLRNGSRGHEGIDFACPVGTPVKAAHSGTIRYVGTLGAYGNYIGLQSDQGFGTGYGHLSRFNVSVGQKVNEGDVIGWTGNTGNSTGPHLHFNFYRQYGVWIYDNPYEILNQGQEMPHSDAEFDQVVREREDLRNLLYQTRFALAVKVYLLGGITATPDEATQWIGKNFNEIIDGVSKDPRWVQSGDKEAASKLQQIRELLK